MQLLLFSGVPWVNNPWVMQYPNAAKKATEEVSDAGTFNSMMKAAGNAIVAKAQDDKDYLVNSHDALTAMFGPMAASHSTIYMVKREADLLKQTTMVSVHCLGAQHVTSSDHSGV